MAEIRRRLAKDFSPRQVEETVDAPRSGFMIRRELAQRGVKGEVAEKALEGLDEADMAKRVGAKFLKRLAGLDRGAFYTRMMGYLRRRGFNYRICADTTQRLWQELSDPAD